MVLLRRSLVVVVLACSQVGFGAEPPKSAASTGRSRITFTESSPLSGEDELLKRAPFKRRARATTDESPEQAKDKLDYDISRESFELFVPRSYKPTAPHGLFIFISAGEAEVQASWFDVFTRRKMIWISPNNAGNDRDARLRMFLAIDAAQNMKQRYNIDPDRIYIAGFSGGAQVASLLIRGFPDVFRGAFCMSGGTFYSVRIDMKKNVEATALHLPFEAPFDPLKKELRLVMMHGEDDPMGWAGAHRANFEAFTLDGFERVTMFEIPNFGHNHPTASWLEKGLLALDEPKPKAPPTTGPTSKPRPLATQVAQAHRLVVTAQYLMERGDRDRARQVLQQVLDDYPTTPAAAEARKLFERIPGGNGKSE